MPQQSDYGKGARRSGLHKAVVGPGQHQKIRDEKQKQETDTQPDERGRQNPNGQLEKLCWAVDGHIANGLHALAEKDVAGWSENYDKKDQNIGLQMQFGK